MQVFDVMGRVTDPVYSVRFNTASEIDRALFAVGTPVFSVLSEAVPVFMDRARQKGTDASNLYEELPEEVRPPLTGKPQNQRVYSSGTGWGALHGQEQEFSDDEKEAAHKREDKHRYGRTSKDWQGLARARGADPVSVRALAGMAGDPRASGWLSTLRRRTLRRMGAHRRRQLARA